MSRNFTLILALLFLASCGTKTIRKGEKTPLKMVQMGSDINFNKSDFYAMAALDSKYIGDDKSAAKYFHKLYSATKNLDFAYEAIRSYGLIKDYKNLEKILDEAKKDHPNDINLKRYLAAYYIDLKEYKKAQNILDSLPKESNKEIAKADEALKATISIGLGNPSKAVDYFKKRYKEDRSAQNALKLFNILYSLKRDDEAIKVLQNHTDFVECNEMVCIKLIALYKERNDVSSIISLTKNLYNTTKKPSYANMLLDLYRYTDDKESAIKFLKKSGFDNLLLLDLYLAKKDFKSAKELSKRLYKESGDLNMLAQVAMIEYESQDKKDKKFLKDISKKFDKVLQKIDNNPLYNNFYGYILIDDNIDIDRGIELVKKALKQRPNSSFFIDSLAWGYYKKGECKKALKTIEPIAKDAKAKEIKEHYKIIKECR